MLDKLRALQRWVRSVWKYGFRWTFGTIKMFGGLKPPRDEDECRL